MVNTTQIARKETDFCHYMDYSFHLAARDLLYAQSHRQDTTYHDFCYTSLEALLGAKMYQWVHHEKILTLII